MMKYSNLEFTGNTDSGISQEKTESECKPLEILKIAYLKYPKTEETDTMLLSLSDGVLRYHSYGEFA